MVRGSEDIVGPHLRALDWHGTTKGGDPLAGVPLGHVDLQNLLHEVLERVVEALEVDTAAVLLVDDSGREVVARAAYGLEEEVRQGVRTLLALGFASIALDEAGRVEARLPFEHWAAIEGVAPERGTRAIEAFESVLRGLPRLDGRPRLAGWRRWLAAIGLGRRSAT